MTLDVVTIVTYTKINISLLAVSLSYGTSAVIMLQKPSETYFLPSFPDLFPELEGSAPPAAV